LASHEQRIERRNHVGKTDYNEGIEGGAMRTKQNPYLNFQDNTREAMEFYRTLFGGWLELQTFEEYHASQDSSEDHKIGSTGIPDEYLQTTSLEVPCQQFV